MTGAGGNDGRAGDRGEGRGCDRWEPLLGSYLFGEVEGAERGSMAEHLAGCGRCREELALLRSAAQALANHVPPADALTPVGRSEILVRARTSRPRRIAFLGPFLAAAAMLLVAGAVAFRGGFGPAPAAPGPEGKPPPDGDRVEVALLREARAPAEDPLKLEARQERGAEGGLQDAFPLRLKAAPQDGGAEPLGTAPPAPAPATTVGRGSLPQFWGVDPGPLPPATRGWYYDGGLPGSADPRPAVGSARPIGVLGERLHDPYSKAAGPSSGTGAAVGAGGVRGAVPGGGTGGVAAVTPVDSKRLVDDFLTRLDRGPGEAPDAMFFRYWGTHPLVEASAKRTSTFAVDVDTASYTLFRSYLYKQAALPPPEAVRTEEFVNYFRAGYPPLAAPPGGEEPVFAIHTELAPSPFAHEEGYRMLSVGIKGREVPKGKRQPCSLVFVVDTSRSMGRENRLGLVKEALKLLVNELGEGDTIGIVAFDQEARVVLDPTPASRRESIAEAIALLEPRQNTNVHAGLEAGYRMAAAHRVKDGSNRVLLLSDGVANTGNTEPKAMLEAVRREREKGIYLTCVGVGMGNHNDALLEALAGGGDGQCVYVDRIEEARKVFVESLTATLQAIARDVKVQVEFEPARVLRYRLLGYENRALPEAAFRDNTADAGEVGAGHEVTALYELKPTGEPRGRCAVVRLRWLTIEDGEAQETERQVLLEEARSSFEAASPSFRLGACAAELAEVLRDSYWARGGSLERVADALEPVVALLGDVKDAPELLALVKRAAPLVRERQANGAAMAEAVDAIKENRLLRRRIEQELSGARDPGRAARLEELRQEGEALRRRLEEIVQRR